LQKSIEILVRAGARELAEAQYIKLSPETNTPDEIVLDLRIRGKIYGKEKIIVECMRMISEHVINKELFSLTLDCFKQIGKDHNDMLHMAKRHFPDNF